MISVTVTCSASASALIFSMKRLLNVQPGHKALERYHERELQFAFMIIFPLTVSELEGKVPESLIYWLPPR